MDTEVWASVDDYWSGKLLAPDTVLDVAQQDAAAAGLPPIQVSALQGKLLNLLARSISARAILEIGTLGGYSTIWLARALPPAGRLVTCELDPRRAELAAANIAMAGLGDVVEVRVGRALDTLSGLAGPFDLAFVDADKDANVEYFDHCVRLVRPGGMIVVDNVVRDGAVVDPASTDSSVVGTRRFADKIATDERVDATAIQTVGAKGYDGFLLALVREK